MKAWWFCFVPLGHSLRPSHYVLERLLWRGTEASHQQQAPTRQPLLNSWLSDTTRQEITVVVYSTKFGVKKQWVTNKDL